MMKRLSLVLMFLTCLAVPSAFADWIAIGPPAGSIEQIIPDRNDPNLWFVVNNGVLYRSTNAGHSWKPASLGRVGRQGSPAGASYAPASNTSVTINPLNSQIFVLRGSLHSTEIWSSTDHGVSFQHLGTTSMVILKIVPHPADPKFLYASAEAGMGLWASADGGRHWSAFTNLPPPTLNHTGCTGPEVDGVELATSPFDADGLFVFGDRQYQCGPAHEPDDETFFVQTSNAGRSWQRLEGEGYYFHTDPVFPARLLGFNSFGIAILTRSGWKSISTFNNVRQLSSVPNHADELFAIKYDFSFRNPLRVFRTSDFGKTWNDIPINLDGYIKTLQAMDDPFRGLLGGTGGDGLFFRNETQGWTPVNSGFQEAVVTSVQASGGTLYAQLRGFLYSGSGTGEAWRDLTWNVPGHYVGSLAVDPRNAMHLLVAGQGLLVSGDGGLTWEKSHVNVCCAGSVLAFNPLDSSIAYAALGNSYGVAGSKDGGKTFVKLGAKFPSQGYEGIVRIVIDPYDPRILYFVVPFWGIFRSTDGGNTVAAAVNGISPPCPSCNSNPAIDLTPLAAKGEYLAITFQGKIYHTNDGGDHWQNIAQGPVKNIAGRILAADGSGQQLYALDQISGKLYESLDGGKSWTDLTGQFGRNNGVFDLTDPRQLPLYAATNHGVFTQR